MEDNSATIILQTNIMGGMHLVILGEVVSIASCMCNLELHDKWLPFMSGISDVIDLYFTPSLSNSLILPTS